jgi:hypothetical protein
MALSCPNCNARFNLGNIQVEHVRCPVCYSIWQINEPKFNKTDSLDLIKTTFIESGPIVVKKSIILAKVLSYVIRLFCILLTLYSAYLLYLHHRHYVYCTDQIKIKELRHTLTDSHLQLRCQIHNIAEKTITTYKAEVCILEDGNKETHSMWVQLTLLPYSANYFTANIALIKNFTNSPNLTIKLR